MNIKGQKIKIWKVSFLSFSIQFVHAQISPSILHGKSPQTIRIQIQLPAWYWLFLYTEKNTACRRLPWKIHRVFFMNCSRLIKSNSNLKFASSNHDEIKSFQFKRKSFKNITFDSHIEKLIVISCWRIEWNGRDNIWWKLNEQIFRIFHCYPFAWWWITTREQIIKIFSW